MVNLEEVGTAGRIIELLEVVGVSALGAGDESLFFSALALFGADFVILEGLFHILPCFTAGGCTESIALLRDLSPGLLDRPSDQLYIFICCENILAERPPHLSPKSRCLRGELGEYIVRSIRSLFGHRGTQAEIRTEEDLDQIR